MNQIYGQMYDFKRLAPGEVTSVESGRILHNCTTLGGNSGSAVIDLASGRALGLHFSGRFLETNYAVRADVVAQRLASLREEQRRSRSAPTPALPSGPRGRVSVGGRRVSDADRTVDDHIFTRRPGSGRGAGRGARERRPITGGLRRGRRADEDVAEEARPADYSTREGYVESFLGNGFTVKLPDTHAVSDDVLTFKDGGRSESVLRYEHFSVVMSQSRRMCLFSAVEHRRSAFEEDQARRLADGPAHPQAGADHEGVLRRPARSSAAVT